MPELPDIANYIRALEVRTLGQPLLRVRIASPFVLRTVAPTAAELEGKTVTGFQRLGKRIVFGLESDLFIVIHLMVSGRLHWRLAGTKLAGKSALAAFDFDDGTLVLTEAATQKRASIHLVRGDAGLDQFRMGGVEPLTATFEQFREALVRENHTVKRALTDPTLFSGIGNAYSDEILHAARLSPVRLTQKMPEAEIRALYKATQSILQTWIDRLAAETGDGFPEKVTAFRDDFAMHGRYGLPCPVCQSPVQRIVTADREANYCVTCQTDGKLLADRALSRLLKKDWPRSLEEMELKKARDRGATDG